MDAVQNLPADNAAVLAVTAAEAVVVLDELGMTSYADNVLRIVFAKSSGRDRIRLETGT